VFEQITVPAPPRRFAQTWNADNGTLYLGVGDGRNGVQVYCEKNTIGLTKWTDTSAITQTKLLQPTVAKWRTKAPHVEGREVFDAVRAALVQYLYFEDDRLYDFLTVWIIGTYVYAVFDYYGYVFLYSAEPRCGKTQALDVIGHLAFDAIIP
jgi:hypothetical protein